MRMCVRVHTLWLSVCLAHLVPPPHEGTGVRGGGLNFPTIGEVEAISV